MQDSTQSEVLAKGFFALRGAFRLTVPHALANVTPCCASAPGRPSRGPNETNVSAQPEQAETHARVSGADEDLRRQKRAQPAAGQGTAAPDGLRPRSGGQNRLARAARLLKAADFGRALKVGRRLTSGPFALHVAHTEGGGVRLGLTVGRRAGAAVVRNRVKRSLREHFRRHRNTFPPGTDLVIVVTRDLSSVSGVALRRAVAEAFRAAAAARPAGGARHGASEPPPR